MKPMYSTDHVLKTASRLLYNAYNSPTASLQDCIDAEVLFTAAEENHSKVWSMPKWHFVLTMHGRAEYYIKRGTRSRIGSRVTKKAR